MEIPEPATGSNPGRMTGHELDDCRSPSTYSGLATLQQLLPGSSRTFSVGIDLWPGPWRQEITVAYLLLRVSDYLEDRLQAARGVAWTRPPRVPGPEPRTER